MEFKIDTKPAYTNITPVVNRLDAKLTDEIHQKWTELQQKGKHNLIIDLHNCISMDSNVPVFLSNLHEELYENEQSLVFTGLQDNILQQLKAYEVYNIINITPTMSEAIDIVNMEILERELFNEE